MTSFCDLAINYDPLSFDFSELARFVESSIKIINIENESIKKISQKPMRKKNV